MDDSNEWELSKENVQPLRHGRKLASLTSALTHTPTDMQQIKNEKDEFERQIRMDNGDDPLEIWDRYIKWTEQHFPRGGKDGNLVELLQRCLTHFKSHDGYKNDPRFVEIWIKFANFIDDPLEIFTFMFDQNIGCELSLFFEEWANFLESLGNMKKADTIYLEGISRGAHPLDVLRSKHSEFQMRVARGVSIQSWEHEEVATAEEQRTVLGRLKADKKKRVGTTRTGTAKLGPSRPLGPFNPVSNVPRQQTGMGFQVFQDENAPSSAPQQTGEYRTMPVRDKLNQENEQAAGVWTKARAPQRKAVVAAAAMPAEPGFTIYKDENVGQPEHVTPLVDSHVLTTKKMEKPGHMLDPIRDPGSADQRPMYCKEKVYCGTQEFSFEELRGLVYMKRKQQKEQEEEQRKMTEQLNEMKLMREQFQKDIENMRAEKRQLLAMQRQMQTNLMSSSQESSGVQPSPMPGGRVSFQHSQDTSGFSGHLSSAPGSASFNAAIPSAPSSASFSAPAPSNVSSASASLHQPTSTTGPQNASLNSSQRTPVFNTSGPRMLSSGSGGGRGYSQYQPRSGGPTPDSNTSKHSLTSASPTINTKEALQMVQVMYNATLECDKIAPWSQEDTEMTGAVAQPPAASAPIVVFDETEQKTTQPLQVPIFCDVNDPDQENSQSAKRIQKPVARGLGTSGGRLALQPKPEALAAPPAAAPVDVHAEPMSEDYLVGEGTEFYPHCDMTLAAVGSQVSFAAAARAASTPCCIDRNDPSKLPSIQLSSIKPHKMNRQPSDEEMSEMAEIANSLSQNSENAQQFRTFNSTGVTLKQDLSPIIEGSTDGSSEESKSQMGNTLGASAHALISTSAVKTRAASHSDLIQSSSAHSTDVEMAPSHPSSEHLDQHVIDTSHYIPAEPDEKTEALLSVSVCLDPHNPFDESTIKGFLSKISPPLEQREGYMACNQHVPNFSGCQFVNLGVETYQLLCMIGKGGYATVYRAQSFSTSLDDSMDDCLDTMDIEASDSEEWAIKVQKPAAPWEFYICSEVHQRLQKLGLQDMGSCMMRINHGYFYKDGSCLLSSYSPHGSLLSLVNAIKTDRDLMANMEPLAAFLTVHLLQMVETLHRCKIIHGDVKPDNILITRFPDLSSSNIFGANNQCLQLMDFGQAIDMSLYARGTVFLAKVETSGFQCIEMRTDQPWTYQTDMFGLAGSLHVLIFGQYMKVYSSQGHWNMTSNFQRKWKVDLWKNLFDQLLNIPDCDHQPDLGALRQKFESHFTTNLAPHFPKVLNRVLGKVRGRSMLS